MMVITRCNRIVGGYWSGVTVVIAEVNRLTYVIEGCGPVRKVNAECNIYSTLALDTEKFQVPLFADHFLYFDR